MNEAPDRTPLEEHGLEVTRRVLAQVPPNVEENGTGRGYGTQIFRDVNREVTHGLTAAQTWGANSTRTELALALKRWRVSLFVVGIAIGFGIGRLW